MKKMFLMAMAILACGAAQAQDYAPESGDVSVEVNFDPFHQSKDLITIDGLKVRYFLNDKMAVRANLGLSLSAAKTTPDTDHDEFYVKSKNGSFEFDLGFEYHFLQSGRLNLYAGGQLGFLRNFASGETVTGSGNNKVTTTYHNCTSGNGNRASTGFGIGAFTGLDFYVYKGLYLGAELGLNYATLFNSETEVEVNSGNNKVSTKSTDKTQVHDLAFKAVPVIRLGWRF